MDRSSWKLKRLNEIFGIPELDEKVIPLHVLVEIRERLTQTQGVGAVILYGSAVKGKAGATSDIDIMIIPVEPGASEKLKKQVQKVLTSIEMEFRLRNPFSLNIFTGLEDSDFLWEVAHDGVVLFSKVETVMSELERIKPYALISYSFNDLDDKNKRYVQRYLFESKNGMLINKRNKQEYIARGVVLLSLDRSKKLITLFETLGVKYGLIKIWR